MIAVAAILATTRAASGQHEMDIKADQQAAERRGEQQVPPGQPGRETVQAVVGRAEGQQLHQRQKHAEAYRPQARRDSDDEREADQHELVVSGEPPNADQDAASARESHGPSRNAGRPARS